MICRQNIEVAIESSIRMRSCQNAALWSAVKFRSILSIQLTILIRSSGTFYYNLAVKWDPSVQKKKHPKKVSRDYNRGAQEYRASKKVLYQLLVCGIGYLLRYLWRFWMISNWSKMIKGVTQTHLESIWNHTIPIPQTFNEKILIWFWNFYQSWANGMFGP